MKKILVCDDDLSFLEKVRKGLEGVSVELIFAVTLDELLHHAETKVIFDAMFLDGYLKDETTTPFLEELVVGKYPYLKETYFFMISSDKQMCYRQQGLLSRDVRFLEVEEGYDAEKLEEWLKENPDARKNFKIPIPDSIPLRKIVKDFQTREDMYKNSSCEKDKVVEKIRELL